MAILCIDHYNFRLERGLMDEVRIFYESVVGLQIGPRPAFSTHGYWLYAGENDVLHLAEETAEDPRRIGSDLSFDHVALQATDRLGHLARLRAAGVPFTEAVVPGSGREQIFFRDPAGNGVELIFEAG